MEFTEKIVDARKTIGLTQEKAAPLLNISVDMLSLYELGKSSTPPDIAYRMGLVYHAPEIWVAYCSKCPLCGKTKPQVELKPIERIALQLINNTSEVNTVRDTIASITADGVITEDEKPQLKKVLDYLDELEKSIAEFRLRVQKDGDLNL